MLCYIVVNGFCSIVMVLTHFFGIMFVYVGMFFLMTASVGVLRFPDFYTRLHPAGVGDSLGAPLVVIGAALYHYSFFVLAKALLIVFIMWVTNTTSCHALSRAAYKSGLRPLIDNS